MYYHVNEISKVIKKDLTLSLWISARSFLCHGCTTSAVNNSVPPKVNFQFAQSRVAITTWPANCISPIIPYHFISGSLCSWNWGWLYLVVAICLLFSQCLYVQPDCIRGAGCSSRRTALPGPGRVFTSLPRPIKILLTLIIPGKKLGLCGPLSGRGIL